jgi:predicted MFS family arabinose efflux permease
MNVPADRLNLSGGPLFALTAMLLLAFAAVVAMPFNISGMVQSFGLTNSTAGLVASTELGAISLSSLYVAQIAGRISPRLIYTVGILAILVANGLTVVADELQWLVALRAIAGIGAGSVTATVMFTAGQSSSPEKTFGVINSFVGIMGMLMALVLPQALLFHTLLGPTAALSAADGLYLVYLLAAAGALTLIRWVPTPKRATPATETSIATTPPPAAPVSGWIALAGLGMIFFGHGALGIYIVELGLTTGLSSQAVGNTFAVASLFGIAAPLIGGWVGANYRAGIPIVVLLCALIVFAVLLANTTSAVGFYVLAPLFSITPMTMIPLALGVLARIDGTGRLTGSHPAFVTLGGAAAPLAGGALRDLSGSFALTGWFVVVCVIVGGLLMFRAIAASDAARMSTAPAAP